MEEDLAKLPALDAETIVDLLRRRLRDGRVYTRCHTICVSVNPYRWLPLLYSRSVRDEYAVERPHDAPRAAHVFELVRRAHVDLRAASQTILVSGESGSGKTELVRICVDYLAHLAEATSATSAALCRRVHATAPILEYFGNAATAHNRNSSRFGKHVSVACDQRRGVVGATITTYLLEHTRVLFDEDRTFHALRDVARDAWRRDLFDALPLVRDGAAVDAPRLVRDVLAAVLLLRRGVDDDATREAAELLRVADAARFGDALRYRRLAMPDGEHILKKLDAERAAHGGRALAQTLYSACFAEVVRALNDAIGARAERPELHRFAVLDFFGFERFGEENGYEQLAINYANERMQWYFVHNALREAVREYADEGIALTHHVVVGNDDAVALFDDAPNGVVHIMEELNRIDSLNATGFIQRLHQNTSELVQTMRVARHNAFVVRHFAGSVTYDATEMLAKNLDPLHSDAARALAESRLPFPRLDGLDCVDRRRLWRPGRFATFRTELNALCRTLDAGAVHYVRCIRPNETASDDAFDDELVRRQIAFCGILDACRVMRGAHPHRMPRAVFERREALVPLVRADGCRRGRTVVFLDGAAFGRVTTDWALARLREPLRAFVGRARDERRARAARRLARAIEARLRRGADATARRHAADAERYRSLYVAELERSTALSAKLAQAQAQLQRQQESMARVKKVIRSFARGT